jgi:uncharacterized protein with GYD domain
VTKAEKESRREQAKKRKGVFMPKFLIQVNFNQEAAKRLIEDGGTKRAAAVRELLKQQEARLEGLYFSPQNEGPDAFAIIEVPVVAPRA